MERFNSNVGFGRGWGNFYGNNGEKNFNKIKFNFWFFVWKNGEHIQIYIYLFIW